jgi:hypothetical protein
LTFIGPGSFVANTGIGTLTMQDGDAPAAIGVTSGLGHVISSRMTLEDDLTINLLTGSQLTITGKLTGPGIITRTGGGVLVIVVTQLVSGPAGFTSATFTNETLAVDFATCPQPCDEFVLLPPDMVQVVSVVVLIGAPTMTGTYNHSTSTLKILGPALIPIFGNIIATVGGFTAQITNYDGAFTWTGTATVGSVSVSGSGLVTVSGVAANTTSTATIKTTHNCYVDGEEDVTGTSLP